MSMRFCPQLCLHDTLGFGVFLEIHIFSLSCLENDIINIFCILKHIFLGMWEYDEVHLGPLQTAPLLPASNLSLLHCTGGDLVYYGISKKGQPSHTVVSLLWRRSVMQTRVRRSHTFWRTQT